MSRGKLKLDANDLLNVMQALAAYKNIFLNAYSTEDDEAVKAGLGRRLEELQDLFRRVHNIRLKMEEQARRDETEAPPPGGIRAGATENEKQNPLNRQ